MKKTGITPTRAENYAEWYQELIRAADLAENSPVRGCMIIKPQGYSLWENIQHKMDRRFKETGHQNAYFPLLIPLNYLEREAKHVEGFAKECAVVTHTKLMLNDDHQLVPCAPLEEPLIVRPTSETIIGEAFSRWVESYRDLPVLINQWANVVRWEMRTRLFLRTSEFLWQEGHTAHATPEEAMEETLKMLEVYREIAEKELAIPVIVGEKTASERFPGAVATYTLEAMMQDKKALQLCTSHFLGQNFARAMGISFIDEDGQKKYAWTTSWGSTTRLIGALIMTHSDDDGLVVPPHIASVQVVILPIIHADETRAAIETYCADLQKSLQAAHIQAQVDTRDMRGGEKRWQWIKRGACCIVEVGAKEVENQAVTFAMRDGISQRELASRDSFVQNISAYLEAFQGRLYENALRRREEASVRISNEEELYAFFQNQGGFALAYWSEDPAAEAKIKNDLKVTVRCIPQQYLGDTGPCVMTGKPACPLAVFAKSY